MVRQNIFILVFKTIFFDTLRDIIRFPLWWYTEGVLRRINGFVDSIRSGEEQLGIRIWIQNIFTPMYGQYDWTGRIISFFIRVAHIIARSIILALWIIVSFFGVLVWLLLPIVVVMQVMYHITVIMTG